MDLLYPPRCVFCRAFLLKNENEICRACINGIRAVDNSRIRKHPEFCDGGVSALYYEKNVKRAVHAFKFRRRRHYAGIFGGMLADAAASDLKHSFDIVTWVPVSAARRKKRGYDQAMLLAAEIARRTGKEACLIECLEKRRDTPPQFGLSMPERRANVLGAFGIKRDAQVRGKTVLVVDDILTTGATLSECAGVLKLEGAEKVFYATFAATGKEK